MTFFISCFMPSSFDFVVSKINLQWSCSAAFSWPPYIQFKSEKPSMEKLNFKHLHEVFGIF